MMIQISGKSTNFGSKMLAPSKKQLIGEVQSSVKSNFGLNQGYKRVPTQLTVLLYLLIMIGEMF